MYTRMRDFVSQTTWLCDIWRWDLVSSSLIQRSLKCVTESWRRSSVTSDDRLGCCCCCCWWWWWWWCCLLSCFCRYRRLNVNHCSQHVHVTTIQACLKSKWWIMTRNCQTSPLLSAQEANSLFHHVLIYNLSLTSVRIFQPMHF